MRLRKTKKLQHNTLRRTETGGNRSRQRRLQSYAKKNRGEVREADRGENKIKRQISKEEYKQNTNGPFWRKKAATEAEEKKISTKEKKLISK